LPPSDEIYARVLNDGMRRRRRALRLMAALSALVVLTAGVVSLTRARDSSRTQAVAADSSGATSTTSEPATTSSAIEPSGATESSQDSSAPPPSEGSTTAATPICRNSTNPDCGPFYWDPDPAPNQPLALSATYSPQNPHVGETVTFMIHAEDPDGDIGCVSLTPPSGDSLGGVCGGGPGIGCSSEPQGPWDTPSAHPSAVDRTYTYTFDHSGSYTLPLEATSYGGPFPQTPDQPPGSLCPRIYDHDPYGSRTTTSITVDVAP
jgi:hypothetical protein